jgi:hypothetical protein
MHTDSDGNIVFRSSKGKFYYSLLAVCFSICVILLVFVAHRAFTGASIPWWFYLGIVSALVIGSVFILMARIIRYVFENSGIRFPHGDALASGGMKTIPEFLPYARIIKFYETRRGTGVTLGLSFDQVWIEYLTDKGKKTGMGLSPKDKQRFISELTKRTGILPSADPRGKTKG